MPTWPLISSNHIHLNRTCPFVDSSSSYNSNNLNKVHATSLPITEHATTLDIDTSPTS